MKLLILALAWLVGVVIAFGVGVVALAFGLAVVAALCVGVVCLHAGAALGMGEFGGQHEAR